MAANKILICAGVLTLIQAMGQIIYGSLALSQYFCVIDFLQELPMLVYIRITYFHNPGPCGVRVNIGRVIEEIADQAFVLIPEEPLTTFRTFIVNCTNLGIAALWIPASIIAIMGGAKNTQLKWIRVPWVLVTVAATIMDLVSVVIFANDSFHTRTLADIMDYIGATASGIRNVQLDTSWVAWIMVIVYSRFVVFFIVNFIFILMVIIDCNAPIQPITTGTQVETPATRTQDTSTSITDEEDRSSTGDTQPLAMIPRPGLSQSFRRMKAFLFRKLSTSAQGNAGRSSLAESCNASVVDRSPKIQHVEMDKKRSVYFPDNLLSLPQRLENLIAEQQRRLDRAVIDTAGRNSPPRASQSMPQLPSTSEQDEPKEDMPTLSRRGTAAELQGQLPWAYIPTSRMRDQLPPDEDLPPVPLPDYTAIQPFRKASVHRAASSLSSLLQHKRNVASTSRREYNVYSQT